MTDIYNAPTDPYPIGALAPQIIKGFKETAKGNGEWGHWYKVETWLGDKWVYAVREFIHESKPFQSDTVNVGSYGDIPNDFLGIVYIEGELYDEPFFDTKTPFALGKQTGVQAVDYSPDLQNGRGWFKVKTWIGEKWVHQLRRNPPKI
ncbi:hypothetical protein N6H14_16355 [Paenibacillus sp. CC-CFT747]|nr:hypothetical protein N6H14_16355 [Paenibacillus sp. CC-CFT747]